MAEQKKAQYSKPASQVDLEERLESGNKSDKVLSTADSYEGPADSGEGRTFAVEDNELDGYVGTSAEYQTYANDTEAPVKADDSAENRVIESFVKGQGELELGVKAKEEDKSVKAESTPQPKRPSGGSTSGN
jgi:hypothetical protein